MESIPLKKALASGGKKLRCALLETAWPTRCVICDAPGTLLCKSCWLALPFVDQSQVCTRCGGPFGQLQCTECNTTLLTAAGIERLPFLSCRSVFTLESSTHRMVVLYKDGGLRELSKVIARLMVPLVDPAWQGDVRAVTYIPDTAAARRRRGFDHSRLLAEQIASILEMPCLGLLDRPRTLDQRTLGRKERMQNASCAFKANPAAVGHMPENVILIDDVITTGATLYAASQVLLASGVKGIRCLTFARAW